MKEYIVSHDDITHQLFINDRPMGLLLLEVDGYYQYYPDNQGYLSSWIMRKIADYVDEINKDWDNKINEYFESQK